MIRATWAAVVTLLVAGCAGQGAPLPPAPGTVPLTPVATPMARIAPAPIPAVFRAPDGKGPFPAVIILHGCGGRGASQIAWAKRLNAWGYAALIPDSLSPRGVTTVCAPGAQPLVTPRDRAGDVAAAAAWLRARPEIDPARIAVLGQSHGGATAALMVRQTYDFLGLKAAVDYYGACNEPAAHGAVPLLALAGEADDWGLPAARCAAYGQALAPGKVFELRTYPGVYHAFERPDQGRSINNGHLLQYNQAAAEDSFARTRAFLDRWVKQ